MSLPARSSRRETHRPRRTPLRRVVAGSLAGMTSLSLLALTVAPSYADSSPITTFTGVASGQGIAIQATNSSIPLLPDGVEGSGPTAQAGLDSLGESLAYASFPYPGAAGAGLTQVVGGLIGVPLPAYPLYVSTSQVPSEQDGGGPGIALHASSQAAATIASAVVGSGTSGSSSTAEVVDNRGAGSGITAEATAKASALDIGGVLTLSGVLSHAKATATDDGKITTTSDLQFADLNVPGLSMTLPKSTPGGPIPAPLGGATITAPHIGFDNGYFTVTLPFAPSVKVPVPASSVLDALAAAGIKATYQAAKPIKQDRKVVGVLAPGMSFTTTLPAPPSSPAGTYGATTVTMSVGQSVASLRDLGLDSSNGGLSGGNVGDALGGNLPGALDTSNSSVTNGPSAAGGPSVPGLTTGANPGPLVAAPGQIGTPAASRQLLSRDSLSIYLALVGVALVGMLSAGAIRFLGVRVAWTS
jgi:hypothetical protein